MTELETGRVTAPHQLVVSLKPLAADAELHAALVEAEEAILAEPGGDGGKLVRDADTGEVEPLVAVIALDHVI